MNKYDVLQNAPHSYQVRTKTQSFVFDFDSFEEEIIFNTIIELFSCEEDIIEKEKLIDIIYQKTNCHISKIEEVVTVMNSYNLLHNNITQNDMKKICVIGDTPLSITIYDMINSLCLFEGNKIITYDEITNIPSFWKMYDLFVVDSTAWNPYYTEVINIEALKYNKPWLLVGGIESNNITIGPLFHGKESGCYNCFISRRKSVSIFSDYLDIYENYLKETKKSSKIDINSEFEILKYIVSNLVALEISRFFNKNKNILTWRKYITLDLNHFNIEKHHLLKKPYCEICNSKIERNISPWLEPITLINE